VSPDSLIVLVDRSDLGALVYISSSIKKHTGYGTLDVIGYESREYPLSTWITYVILKTT